jgi:outer membrane protein TolC
MKIVYTYILIIVFSVSISAQNTYDLKRCIDTGLEQNYDIKIVKKQQEIVDNNATPGNAGYLPTISFDAGYNGNFYNFQNQYPAPSGDKIANNNFLNQNLNAALNLQWTIFDGMKIQTNYQRLKQLQNIGQQNIQANIELFIYAVANEYYYYIEHRNIYENLLNAVELSKERLRIVQERYTIGAASRLDFQQATVDFNSDHSKLIQQNENLFASQLRLNQLMALEDLEQSLNINDSIILLNKTFTKEELLQTALEKNIYLLLLREEKELSLLDLKNYKSTNYPYLKFNTGYGYQHYFYNVGANRAQNNLGANFGLNLGYVIFDGMNRKRNIENSKIALDIKQIEEARLISDITTNFNRSWMLYQNNLTLIELERENTKVAQAYYAIAMDRFKLGDLSGIELREAQNSFLESEQRHIQAKYNTKICEIALMQICGMLNVYME